MYQPAVSVHQLRIAVAVLSLALFVQTSFWLVYDAAVRGLPGAWEMWTTGWVPGLSATSSLDLGLAALQLTAGVAAFLGTRGAGGLLVTACAVTLGFRLPAVWYFLLNSPDDPWFGSLKGPSVNAVGGSAVLAVALALILGVLLLLARHIEYEAAAADGTPAGRIRPVKVTATTSGVLLGVLNVFYICRNTVTAFQVGPSVLGDLLVGKGTGRAILGVSTPYQWACLTVLCGAGMLLAARRRPVATGFSTGLSLFMMPPALTDLWAYLQDAMGQTLVDGSQHVLEFVGSAAVVALTVGDVRRDRRPAVIAADNLVEAGPAPVAAAVAAAPAEAAVTTTVAAPADADAGVPAPRRTSSEPAASEDAEDAETEPAEA
ncbi:MULTISPECIES: hypothetical protein [unclassified Streptomyces]|uniref:hypothetical protein n=1 Tax=unclassified Streptomyces TaxID=2593676 RepID=UPI00380959CC